VLLIGVEVADAETPTYTERGGERGCTREKGKQGE
jgi:hypothetical protein